MKSIVQLEPSRLRGCQEWRNRYIYLDPRDILNSFCADPDNDFVRTPPDLLKIVQGMPPKSQNEPRPLSGYREAVNYERLVDNRFLTEQETQLLGLE